MRGKGVNSLYGKIMLALGFALLWSGCGISTTAYLYPPANLIVSGSQISVQNNGANYEPSEGLKQTFKGIDIYYRIFQNNLAAGNLKSDLITRASSTYYDSPDAFISYAEGRGLCIMRKATGPARPTVDMEASDESLHTIVTSTWILDDGTQVVRDGFTSPKNDFSEKTFASTDQDYEGEASSGGGTFYLVLFAVSYGEDSIGAPVYSYPVIASSIVEFF